MTEDEARAWLRTTLAVSDSMMARLDRFVRLLGESQQNLVSLASLAQIWSRHIVDSAQLIPLALDHQGRWLDIGSGAGFPGLICAALSGRHVNLVEPRRLRCNFLIEAATLLECAERCSVHQSKLETLRAFTTSIISARAVAPLPTILRLAHRFSSDETRWLLPRGAKAHKDLAEAEVDWRGVFHVKQSVTDYSSSIVIADGVHPR